MPVFHLAKAMQMVSRSDPLEHREEEFRKLLHVRQERSEVKPDQVNHTDHILQMPRILEELFFCYSEIFKDNWNSMTNTWYQNHRDLALDTRKISPETNKNERPVSSVRPETVYQPQIRICSNIIIAPPYQSGMPYVKPTVYPSSSYQASNQFTITGIIRPNAPVIPPTSSIQPQASVALPNPSSPKRRGRKKKVEREKKNPEG